MPSPSPSTRRYVEKVPPPTPQPTLGALPPGWEERRDPSGRIYLYNPNSTLTDYEAPASIDGAPGLLDGVFDGVVSSVAQLAETVQGKVVDLIAEHGEATSRSESPEPRSVPVPPEGAGPRHTLSDMTCDEVVDNSTVVSDNAAVPTSEFGQPMRVEVVGLSSPESAPPLGVVLDRGDVPGEPSLGQMALELCVGMEEEIAPPSRRPDKELGGVGGQSIPAQSASSVTVSEDYEAAMSGFDLDAELAELALLDAKLGVGGTEGSDEEGHL